MEESEDTEIEQQDAVEETRKKSAAEKKKRATGATKKKLMLQQETKPQDPRCASLTHVLPSYATLRGPRRILTSVVRWILNLSLSGGVPRPSFPDLYHTVEAAPEQQQRNGSIQLGCSFAL